MFRTLKTESLENIYTFSVYRGCRELEETIDMCTCINFLKSNYPLFLQLFLRSRLKNYYNHIYFKFTIILICLIKIFVYAIDNVVRLVVRYIDVYFRCFHF